MGLSGEQCAGAGSEKKPAVDGGKFCRGGRNLPGPAQAAAPKKLYVSDVRASAHRLQDHGKPQGRG